MDAFLEPFWNLDQIRGWAETRDPEIIRAAAWPRYGQPKKTLEIAIRTTHTRPLSCETGATSTVSCGPRAVGLPRLSRLVRPQSFRIMPKSMDGPLISPTDTTTSKCTGWLIPKR